MEEDTIVDSSPGGKPGRAVRAGQNPGAVPEGSPAWGRTVLDTDDAPVSYGAFRVVSGAEAGRLIDLRSSGDTRIGRDVALNDVVIADAQVSAQHVIVRAAEGRFHLIDLGSTNGTLVNEEQVMGQTVLANGDRVTMGKTVAVFHLATVDASDEEFEPEGGLAAEVDQG